MAERAEGKVITADNASHAVLVSQAELTDTAIAEAVREAPEAPHR